MRGNYLKMGTQGLVTIMSGNEVLMKAVCGCDGYNNRKLTYEIKKTKKLNQSITPEKVYELAEKVKFGCDACRIVITADNKVVMKDQDEELPELWFKTIQNPKFNPRWECGLAERLSILHLEKLNKCGGII